MTTRLFTTSIVTLALLIASTAAFAADGKATPAATDEAPAILAALDGSTAQTCGNAQLSNIRGEGGVLNRPAYMTIGWILTHCTLPVVRR